MRAGPITVAKPRNSISAGWAYSEVNPKGVAYLHVICHLVIKKRGPLHLYPCANIYLHIHPAKVEFGCPSNVGKLVLY